MHRLLSLMILGLASIPAMAAKDATEASPSPGQWSTIVAILDSSNMRYEKEESPPNYEYKKAKVLELRCVREPFEGELVSR